MRKIRIPITDQFLWIVYNFFEKTGEILEPPEIFKLRSFRNIVPLGTGVWRILEKKRRRRQFAQFVNHLKRQGYIKIANVKEKRGILLTPKGKKKVLRIRYKLLAKKSRKDKKWIMVIFDIPEKMRKHRNEFRAFLISFGFQRLQKSVWVCPYDVLKDVEEIIRIYSLDKFVRIFLIEEIKEIEL